MRILIHDYCGHGFQIQLSRALARAGHSVRHVYSASFQTAKGAVQRRADDPATFEITGLTLRRPFAKYEFHKRVIQELEYGRLVAKDVLAWRPDIVLSANMPLDPQAVLVRACRKMNIPFVFWLQDVHSIAIDRFFSQKIPFVGRLIGNRYHHLERSLLGRSNAVVCICDDFRQTLRNWQIDGDKITVIPNWAPLDEVANVAKANDWSKSHQLDDKFVFLYSGTLGIKHNPSLLHGLASQFASDAKVRVVVLSEGPGADWLHAHPLPNLTVLSYVTNERFPQVLGSADVFVTLLSADAGTYSVPSKVLSYLAAGRANLASVPPENLAARLLVEHTAGIVASPDQPGKFLAGARQLRGDAAMRERLAANGLAYAQRTFDIDKIATRFLSVLAGCLRGKPSETTARSFSPST